MPTLPANDAPRAASAERVVLVTGAASNLGRASAIALADAGARVFVTDINTEGLADTVARIERAHGSDRVAASVVDLVDPDAPNRLVHDAATRWDGLDTIVHCAVDPARGDVGTWTTTQWEAAFAVNVRAAAFLVQEALPQLTASDQASVVMLSSIHAQITHAWCVLYAATKGAVDSLTRGLAVELGPRGIRVNAIHPGWVPAEPVALTAAQLAPYPLARVGRPEEIAAAVVFLTSSASAWTTGAILTIDGGLRALSPEASSRLAATLTAADGTSSRLRQRIKRFAGPIRR